MRILLWHESIWARKNTKRLLLKSEPWFSYHEGQPPFVWNVVMTTNCEGCSFSHWLDSSETIGPGTCTKSSYCDRVFQKLQ